MTALAEEASSVGNSAPRPSAIAHTSASRVLYISYASVISAKGSKIGPARRNFHIVEQLTRFYDVAVLSLGSLSDAALFQTVFGDRVRQVHYAPFHRGVYRKFAAKAWRTLTRRCDFMPTHEPELRRLCAMVTQRETFDAIVLSNVLLRALPLPAGVPIVGDTHNVEFDFQRRMSTTADSWIRRGYASLQYGATKREETRAAHNVDLLLATSERDGNLFLSELQVPHVVVIPNGVDLVEFTQSSGSGRPGVILFAGLMSYYPNQQAIRWFLDHVFPAILRHVPDAKLVAAGAAPPRWLVNRASENLQVTGPVPDIRPYLEAARVVIAPIRVGGGTRVKILEAMAVGRPVVSTSIGAEGLNVRDGESILLADEADTFARHVADALTNDWLRDRLATAGRRYVVQHHDWNGIGGQLERVLSSRVGLTRREGIPAKR